MEDYFRVRFIIEKLLELQEGEELPVDYFLTRFLIKSYQKKAYNIDILEHVYDICKTPFGNWVKGNNGINQIITSKSLQNFLRYYRTVYILDSNSGENIEG
jgi:hypothetical protein